MVRAAVVQAPPRLARALLLRGLLVALLDPSQASDIGAAVEEAACASSHDGRPPGGCTSAGGERLGDGAIAVRASGLPHPGAGLGAFALRSFERGEAVGVYRCDVLRQNDKQGYSGGQSLSYQWMLNATHAW